jgi:hypothetical protein
MEEKYRYFSGILPGFANVCRFWQRSRKRSHKKIHKLLIFDYLNACTFVPVL